MQKTSLPCSLANPAVMEVPLLNSASTISTPKLKPLTILFLCLNVSDTGIVSAGYSLTISPLFSKISLYIFLLENGKIFLGPPPKTAIVFPLNF